MAWRKDKAKKQEEEVSDSLFQRQLNSIIETQLTRYPLLVQLRAVWRQLQAEQEGRPLIIALLVIVFIGTYRAERKRAKQIIEANKH